MSTVRGAAPTEGIELIRKRLPSRAAPISDLCGRLMPVRVRLWVTRILSCLELISARRLGFGFVDEVTMVLPFNPSLKAECK